MEDTMAKSERMTYLGVNLKDKPGALLKVMRGLKARNIGLSGLWGFVSPSGKAHLYVVAKNPRKLRAVWKAEGVRAEAGTGFCLKGSDRTGVLLQPLEALAKAKVNILAIHAIAVGGKFGSYLWVDAATERKAAKALGAK
jgi:hypothetical protein